MTERLSYSHDTRTASLLHLKCDRLTSSLDEFAQLAANSGPAWPIARFPAPIGPKSCAMPPQDRVRLNDAGQTEQARPPSGHPNHQGTVTCPKSDTLWGWPRGDVEVVTQKKVLDFKPAWRLEQIGYERCKENDRKHRIG